MFRRCTVLLLAAAIFTFAGCGGKEDDKKKPGKSTPKKDTKNDKKDTKGDKKDTKGDKKDAKGTKKDDKGAKGAKTDAKGKKTSKATGLKIDPPNTKLTKVNVKQKRPGNTTAPRRRRRR